MVYDDEKIRNEVLSIVMIQPQLKHSGGIVNTGYAMDTLFHKSEIFALGDNLKCHGLFARSTLISDIARLSPHQ